MRLKLSSAIAVTAVAVTVAGGVSGCGAINTLSAKQQVSQAISSLSDAKSATFTLSLDTSKTDIKKIAKAQGDPISPADLKILGRFSSADVQYSLQAGDGKTIGDTLAASQSAPQLESLLDDPAALSAYIKDSGAASFSVRLAGDVLAELRLVNGVFYGRAVLPKILELADEDPAQIDEALADLPPGLEPLRKAAKGGWISLDLNKAVKVLKEQGALDDLLTSSPTPSINPAQVNKLLADLKAAYEKNVTITELGDGDRGKGYQLSASAKQVGAGVQDDLISIIGKDSAKDIRKSLAEIPDKPVNLVVWVDGDKLSGMSLDVIQFLDKPVPGAKLAIDVDVDVDTGDISAPSGASALDVQELVDGLTSALTGLGGSLGGDLSGDLSGDLGDLGDLDPSLGSLQDQIDAATGQ